MNDALEIVGAKVRKKRGRKKSFSLLERGKSKKRKKRKKEEDYLVDGNVDRPKELKYKEKRLFDDVKTWELKEFYPNLKNPFLRLEQWKPLKDTNKFSDHLIFNEEIELIQYSNEEYELIEKYVNVLETMPAEPGKKAFGKCSWTKEQTDELFRLCKEYDLRFYVINDRLSFEKTLEEIKVRYYSIAQAVLYLRCEGNMEKFLEHPIMKSCYEHDQEKQRKEKMKKFFERDTSFDIYESHAQRQLEMKNQEIRNKDSQIRMKSGEISKEESTIKYDSRTYLRYEKEKKRRKEMAILEHHLQTALAKANQANAGGTSQPPSSQHL